MNDHNPGARRALFLAFLITVVFLSIELAAAVITNSLALLADAGHMLGDSMALAMALAASYLARKKADGRKSFGYGRAEVLVAFLNAFLLLAVAAYAAVRAAGRLRSPEPVAAEGMLVMAVAGLAANAASGMLLLGQARKNINAKAALLHVAGDALGSVGVLAAALIVLATGWMRADPLVSFFICALIVAGGVRLLLESLHILMEGVPAGFSDGEARRLLCSIGGIVSVHDIHAWSITSGSYAATIHLVVGEGSEQPAIQKEAARLFREKWGIEHLTVQVEAQSETGECGHSEFCRIMEAAGKEGGGHDHGH